MLSSAIFPLRANPVLLTKYLNDMKELSVFVVDERTHKIVGHAALPVAHADLRAPIEGELSVHDGKGLKIASVDVSLDVTFYDEPIRDSFEEAELRAELDPSVVDAFEPISGLLEDKKSHLLELRLKMIATRPARGDVGSFFSEEFVPTRDVAVSAENPPPPDPRPRSPRRSRDSEEGEGVGGVGGLPPEALARIDALIARGKEILQALAAEDKFRTLFLE
jgi:hypothetical protein